MDKLRHYQGFYGRFHDLRDECMEKFKQWKEDRPEGITGMTLSVFKADSNENKQEKMEENLENYDHVYRSKTRSELIRISAAVMGIEFSYAAETAFVSPILLKIGVEHEHMTMVWALSPLLGFLVTPVLGSLSDGCRLSLGRRRPFILLLAIGVLFGLILIPNGEDFGRAMGDIYPSRSFFNSTDKIWSNNDVFPKELSAKTTNPWGIFLTVLGTVLLDFDADTCQSPARAYLLDVTVPDDHARGLSTFTVMAGLGGFFGYALGGIDWDVTVIGEYLAGHVRTVFTLITVLFIVCITSTVTSFKEIPLSILEKEKNTHLQKLAKVREAKGAKFSGIEDFTYGTIRESSLNVPPLKESDLCTFKEDTRHENPSLKEYLLSIAFMPKSLKMVCLTNLFCWMSHVCYSLYFTDFVGEAVFNGNPSAPLNSVEYKNYEEGVRFGCWGMSMYSLSCSFYSLIIETLIKRFKAKRVYVGGLLFYSLGMMLLAVTKGKIGVIVFSWTAGVMYSTLFTMPYLLVANYHSNGIFGLTNNGEVIPEKRQRGLGTDIGIVSSMVFLAQFILALAMGEIVKSTGTTTAVITCASLLAFCGGITATKIMYLNL